MKRIKLAFPLSTLGVLIFGFALASMFYLGLESQNEHNFLDRINRNIESTTSVTQADRQDDEFIKNAVHSTYYLLQRRTEIFHSTSEELPLKERFFHSPIRASIDGYGDCGGYSVFLMSLLDRKGYDVKPCQMKVNGEYGGHITVCIQLPGRLVIVDPLYNETFEDANGNLSDIKTVASHWPYYRSRISNPEYRDEYDYSKGYRFTNWNKLGVVTRAMHASLSVMGGQEWADTISLRPYFMDTYKIGFYLSAMYVLLYLVLNAGKIVARLHQRYFKGWQISFQRPFEHSKA